LKNSLIKLLFLSGILAILIACSTKKDRFLNRNFQALNTKYNVMYNGDIALDKGIEDLKAQYNDNFWAILPVERMVIGKESNIAGPKTTNANFERAEEKATKAIQKRSMNIDGREVNSKMDEAHLLLGKARYYDLRFVPALEAFNYVLYKYPNSDKIYEVKIWREKTNMRMENDAIAVINLRKLMREIKFKDQIFADANATLAQAFLNLQEKDSALARLGVATKFTKSLEEKARYLFIKGQLMSELGKKDSAFSVFQTVIEMNRKSPRRYVIQAHLQQAKQFNATKGDTIAFLKKFNDLLEDRENRPFLDYINHQLALFYDGENNHQIATKYYNASLKKKTQDQYLVASNYRNLATLNFDDAKYPNAGKYYDSTLTALDARSREHKAIKKKRENLEDVIKYEAIAQNNDSILNLLKMPKDDQIAYFDKYILELKLQEKKQAELQKKQEEKTQMEQNNTSFIDDDNPMMSSKSMNPSAVNIGPKNTESFYFYNQSSVSFGKNEFRKKWGKRSLSDNWRWSQGSNSDNKEGENEKEKITANDENQKDLETKTEEDERYTPVFYIAQLPTKKVEIDSVSKERNFAYYQLGTIYKEKFQEYKLAADKLEKLLENNPEERLILPAMYNLFKIYQIINPTKALAMKQQILVKYPDSRYAQIISNNGLNAEQLTQTPDAKYEGLYKKYEKNVDVALLDEVETAIDLYTGDEIASKFEFLKANIDGKLKGVDDYKKALNFVALNYPNSKEGKSAEELLTKNIPYLQQLKFNGEKPTSWKLIYNITDTINSKDVVTIDKIKKFTSERTAENLSYSVDTYYMSDILLVVHGIPSESKAQDIITILRDYKDFNIKEPVVIASTENYKVLQIQKNLEDYIKNKSDFKEEVKKEEVKKEEVKLELKTEDKPDVEVKVKSEGKKKADLRLKGEMKQIQIESLDEIGETVIQAKKQ
jgi:tetratricopeptide (TPR) repeat protein